MRTTILALSLVLLIGNVVTGLESENIINGLEAQANQFKYQVSVRIFKFHICGGALIAPDIVLSAYHCFHDQDSSTFSNLPYTVVAGSVKLQEIIHMTFVTRVYGLKNYKQNKNGVCINDIAVLKLEKSFLVSNVTSGIGLALLPNKLDKFDKQQAVIAGFGMDQVTLKMNPKTGKKDKRAGLPSHVLKFEIIMIQKCKQKKNRPIYVCGFVKYSSTRVPKGTCSGDSGSPLIVGTDEKATVIGILSSGPMNCTESATILSTYTRVSEYLNFIEDAKNGIVTSNMTINSINYKIYDMYPY